MLWLKYKHKFAYGSDKEWSWVIIEYDLESSLEELSEEFNWSEHYRGMDYEVVEIPPLEVLEKEIKSAEKTVENYQRRVVLLKEIRDKQL